MPSTSVNYTPEQVSKMIEDYQAAKTDADRKSAVSEIAKELGKSVKSVIAKLCREDVYVKAEKVTKSGKAIVKKEDIVRDIADTLSIDFDNVKSLGKATKADLELLLESLQ